MSAYNVEVNSMALVRWEPLREINSLQREMNRLFDTLTPATPFNGDRFMPVVEMQETSDAVQLKIELPGIDIKDLDVQVTADSVAISGNVNLRQRAKTKASFDRSFTTVSSSGSFHCPYGSKIRKSKQITRTVFCT